MKIKESQLRNIIKEAINEYRSSSDYENLGGGNKGYDGDHWYVRPNGETPDRHDALMGDAGKRGKMNFTYNNDSTGKAETSTVQIPNKYSHGKGNLCIQLQRSMNNILFGNKKVVWTDAEKKMIEDIEMKIGELAILTKKEGNKKRGYVRESQLRRMIRESLRHVLNEWKESGTIYGKATYNPDEELYSNGIDFGDFTDKRLWDLMCHDYEISFIGRGYSSSGDYDNPPECGINHAEVSDDSDLKDAIQQIRSIDPKIADAVEKDYANWCHDAMSESGYGSGQTIEWGWDNLGYNDQPEYEPDEYYGD